MVVHSLRPAANPGNNSDDDFEVIASAAPEEMDDSPEWLERAANAVSSLPSVPSTTDLATGGNDAHQAVGLERLVLLFGADTTGSMGGPIVYGIKLLEACMDYLAGISSSDQIETLEVVVYVVGMNDWKDGERATHPVKLFLNEDESNNALRPIGYSFVLDKTKPEEWQSNVQVINAAIKAMAASTTDGTASGGDSREEYATGVHFMKTIVEQDKKDFPDARTKYFLLSITDDMQHGMSTGYGGDSWPSGVTEASIYGENDMLARKYACPYAPDKHPRLGFPCWKPHSFWASLNGLLDLGVTVVWCPIGSSARHCEGSAFEAWVGTLSTVFEYRNGVVLSWASGEANKPVPGTVAHLLNTLITSASISGELDVEKRRQNAAKKAEALMKSAKSHSQATGGSLKQVPTTIDGAAAALDQLVVESGLSELLQGIFLGTSQPTDASSKSVQAAYRSLKTAHEMGDVVSADRDIAVAYRSLSAECNPPAMPPPPPTPHHRSLHRPSCGDGKDAPLYRSLTMKEVEALEGVPEYRSLGASEAPAPIFRSLGKSHVAEVAGDLPEYRSLGASGGASVGLPAAPVAVPAKRNPNASKNRLLRLSSA
jgi:hypothetical protein